MRLWLWHRIRCYPHCLVALTASVLASQAQAPLRKAQLLHQELAALQRAVGEAAGDAPFVHSAQQRAADLGRRQARRLARLHALLTSSHAEVRGAMFPSSVFPPWSNQRSSRTSRVHAVTSCCIASCAVFLSFVGLCQACGNAVKNAGQFGHWPARTRRLTLMYPASLALSVCVVYHAAEQHREAAEGLRRQHGGL